MSLPIKKVYVNSRYKAADSVSDSNFRFKLPYVLTMPHNAIFTSQLYVFLTCLKSIGENDVLYVEYTVQWNGIFDSSSVTIYNSVTLPPGNYTELGFAQALDQQLNTETKGVIRAEYGSTNNICAIYIPQVRQQHLF